MCEREDTPTITRDSVVKCALSVLQMAISSGSRSGLGAEDALEKQRQCVEGSSLLSHVFVATRISIHSSPLNPISLVYWERQEKTAVRRERGRSGWEIMWKRMETKSVRNRD